MDQQGEHAGETLGEVERIRIFDALRTEERRASVSRFTSTVSHALGTPLNVIAGRAGMIGLGELDEDGVRDNARIIQDQVRSVTRLIQSVLRFAREGLPAPEPCDLGALARRAVELLRPLAAERQVRLELSGPASIPANAHPLRILHVLVNLIDAGLALFEGAGEIVVTAGQAHARAPELAMGSSRPGEHGRFVITYEGLELAPALFQHVLEPWLESEHAGERSTTLLFAVSFGVVREHGGWVEVTNDRPGTTSFTVHWPLVGE